MPKRFRVALSFAGEKRDFVAPVARILAQKFGEDCVLYDKYHRAEFARSNLATYLPDLYLEQADLVVVVICKDYNEKEWTGLEWDAVLALRMKRKTDEVMLCRFDYAEGKGMLGLAGYFDLDKETPQSAAACILERLAINEGLSKGHVYPDLKPADPVVAQGWPDEAPELRWPVADHREARAAFGKLITRGTEHRYLPIVGQSETGKSHLTKQFWFNGVTLKHVRCARFDFKGSSDMDLVLRQFAKNLAVKEPTKGAEVSMQLGEIFTGLTEAPRPTLLIFDTFEQAGKAEDWMKQTVLPSLVLEEWLRVTIVGQDTAPANGEMWQAVSAPRVTLHPPTPEDWFEYGQQHKPKLTLEFVRSAYDFCGGKTSTLAGLCGPAA
jgi:hypothetical protein